MVATAAGFALLAALSPAAVVVGAVYLASARPHRTMLLFLAGAVLMSLVTAIAVLVLLRAGGLSLRGNRTPRYGLRLGLGLLALTGGAWLIRRGPRRPKPGKKPGLVARLTARPRPVLAFLTGVLVFAPSASFVAAVQVIATARSGVTDSALTLALVVAIDVAAAWLPLVLYLLAPQPTARVLNGLNAGLRAHGHAIAAGALIVAGLLLVVDGATHLA